MQDRVRLTQDMKGKQGYIWSRKVCPLLNPPSQRLLVVLLTCAFVAFAVLFDLLNSP